VISRRDLLLAGAGGALAAAPAPGVELGVVSYSFRELPFDAALAAMKTLGMRAYELWDGNIALPGTTDNGKVIRQAKEWRQKVPAAELAALQARLRKEGLKLVALTSIMQKEQTDAELERVFEIAAALGTRYVFSSCNVSMAGRLDAIAGKRGMKLAIHNHSRIGDDQVATPDDFARAMDGHPNICLNLDVGHFVAAGFDPLRCIEQHHGRILGLHLKDRKKDQGANVPFGEGDTPVREILQMMKRNRYRFPALIEYEYKGGDPVAEVRRSLDYCRNALAG
jgi:sugar phosphate isomerase/epimerase